MISLFSPAKRAGGGGGGMPSFAIGKVYKNANAFNKCIH
jgi:hypothetical protein